MMKGSPIKSLIFAVITAAAFTLILVGCSKDSNQIDTTITKAAPTSTVLPSPRSYTPTPSITNTPTATPTPESPLGIDPADLDGVSIDFWHSWPGEAGTIINDLVDEFNMNNQWGIQAQVAYQGGSDDIYHNVLDAIDEKQPPDLAVGYLFQALAWDSEWELVNLKSYVDDPVWGLTGEEQADFYPVFWEYDVSGGRRLGLPAQRTGQVLYYNTTWAEELGFSSPPSTPEEFAQQACAAARANQNDEDPENDGTGGLFTFTNYSAVLGLMAAFGADVTPVQSNSTTEGAYDFDNTEVEASFSFLRSLYEDGCAWISDNQYPETDLASRRSLLAADSFSAVPIHQEAFRQAGSGDQWTLIPFPSPLEEPAINVYGPSFEILSSTPEEQLAAWLLVKWLVIPENQARLVGANRTFPLQKSVFKINQESGSPDPQMEAAVVLLASAHSEPAFASWKLVRWAVSDAATQLFRFYFTLDQLPDMVAFLHQTANDLHTNPLKDSSIKTPTPSATPTIEATPAGSRLTETVQPTSTP